MSLPLRHHIHLSSQTQRLRFAITAKLCWVIILLTNFTVAVGNTTQTAPMQLPGHVHTNVTVRPPRHYAEPVYHVRRAEHTPVIDGYLDEWEGVPAIVLDQKKHCLGQIRWEGPEELSGAMRIMWDEKALYFALDVTDDILHRNPKPYSVWENDSCQFVFDTLLNGPRGYIGLRDYNLCVSKLPEGPRIIQYRTRPGQETEHRFPEHNISFMERQGGYIYEWAIPWKYLPPISPWILGRCGFSFTISEQDNHGFEGALGWTKGILLAKDHAALGQLIFDGAPGTADAVLEIPTQPMSEQTDSLSPWTIQNGSKIPNTASIVFHSVQQRTVTSTIKIFGPLSKQEPIAIGRIEHELKPGEVTAYTWDLTQLLSGMYEIEFDNDWQERSELFPRRWAYQQFESPPAPVTDPPWVEGFRVRYKLRVIGELRSDEHRTIIARVPTGGWLNPDASDIVVTTATGEKIPVFVLSHDPTGDTIIQFWRNDRDLWYWLYASNPNAPSRNVQILEDLTHMKQAAAEAARLKMHPQMVTGKLVGKLRDIQVKIKHAKSTISNAEGELAEWSRRLPQLQTKAQDLEKIIAPLRKKAKQATVDHALFKVAADQATVRFRKLKRDADSMHNAMEAAARVYKEALDTGLDTSEAQLTLKTAKTLNLQAKAEAELADAEARATRLAAAPTNAAKQETDRKLAGPVGELDRIRAAIAEGRQRIPQATGLKNSAEQTLSELTPLLLPAQEAADAAMRIADPLVADAKIKAAAYEKLARHADRDLLKEGVSVEYRDWVGEDLDNWLSVLPGLMESKTILGSALVGQVAQNVNPFRRDVPRNFAASYRGYLKIDNPGIYGFFLNGDDAAFLFINGYKVYARTGSNQPIGNRIKLYSIGSYIQLEAGLHPFEIHHVVGNSPTASGKLVFYWLTPGAQRWTWVPPRAFSQPLQAVPIYVEAYDGTQVATFVYGMDDTLSADGVTLYLTSFAAEGDVTAPDQLIWLFDDGSTTRGQHVDRIFFEPGHYEVSLISHPKLPPFKRRISVWTPPIPTGPHSLAKAVKILDQMDLSKLSETQRNDAYHFLRICEQPSRWPVLEQLCRYLLAQEDLDVSYRTMLYASLMEAMAQQGKATEGLALLNKAITQAGQVRTLRYLLMLTAANLNRDSMRNFAEAERFYAQIIGEGARLIHPMVRHAASAWGDMYLYAGDMARAGEAYRLAMTLGSIGAFREQGSPAKRGALLRVAEQQLRTGNVRQTRRLLHRIEAEFPDQKLEGLYRFLRGESERYAGRYEQAIEHYQILIRLRQWAGYRADALYGIADSYNRMGLYNQSLQWLDELHQSFPHFFEQRNLEMYRLPLGQRAARLAEQGQTAAFFSRLDVNLEADRPYGMGVMPAMGFGWQRAAYVHSHSSPEARFAVQHLKNLPAQGSLRVEMWYRDRSSKAGDTDQRLIRVRVRSASGEVMDRSDQRPQRTFGRWHKAAFNLTMPPTDTGSVIVEVRNLVGLLEVGGLTVQHVSDWENDALHNFIEGANPQ